MTGMLASVANIEEALMVLDAGVDIIDLKQPAQGALGALEPELVIQILDRVNGRTPVSATIGDLPMDPEKVSTAVDVMAATGVDFIKIGFFPNGDWQKTIEKLTDYSSQGIKMIAVLFADTRLEIGVVERLKQAGFTGVMLDTMKKTGGSLSTVMSNCEIQAFVKQAKQHSLLCGLAGSLGKQDIPYLIALNPDYLGFRGALCNQRSRTAPLDKNSVLAIKSVLANNRAGDSFSHLR